MGYVRGFFIASCLALAGAAGGVIALNLATSSPRLMIAGIVGALIGIIGGGMALGTATIQRPD